MTGWWGVRTSTRVRRPVGPEATARVGAAVIRSRAFDRRFKPFDLGLFLSSPDIQRFVPGPTWSYVPPRDRPKDQVTGCVCKASSVPGMLHIEHCSARQVGDEFRNGGLWS